MVEDVGFNFGKLLEKCLMETLPGDDFTNEEMDLRQDRPLLYANVAR